MESRGRDLIDAASYFLTTMSVTSTLIPLALEANKAHQVALTEYAQSLTDELKELDSILVRP